MSGARITGGSARGRAVRVPASARPTSGRVREAVFARWQEAIAGAAFLDLFAGSGIVGLEAASRGAARVTWVEEDRRAAQTLAANLAALHLDGDLRRGEALRVVAELAAAGARFDLVYADPPYAWNEGLRLLAATAPLVGEGGELALEHSGRAAPPETAAGLRRVDTRRYGDSAVSFYRRF
jgi:16S rRNA (guanine966-N2)-methyltransferase